MSSWPLTKVSHRQSWQLFLLLAAVVLIRVLLVFIIWKTSGPLGFFRGDTNDYVVSAQQLMHGAFLSSGAYSLPGTPEIYRTPGYSLLLVPALALGHLVSIGIFENLVFSVFCAWMVWRIATDLSGTKAAWWAVLFFVSNL